jgi:tRNA threonylcarbamoyladenosine biosynthesis protein TsaB
MSLILSIETSTKVCSVALHAQGELIAVQELFQEKSHSGMLAVLIKDILGYAGRELTELSAIALAKGPGSYTGLRIGTATAKGLCYALEVPLISVNTLEAMASQASNYNVDGAMLCPMLDARRMEVYYMCFNHKMEIIEETQPLVVDEHSFEAILSKGKVLFFGNGAEKCKAVIGNRTNAFFLDQLNPSAKTVGSIALEKFNNNEFEDLAYFEPFYLKDVRITSPKKGMLKKT